MTKRFDLHYTSTDFGTTVKTIRHLNATTWTDAITEAERSIPYIKGYGFTLKERN